MKKINAIVCGIASIFTCPNNVMVDVFEKYPSTYEPNVQKSLQKSWLTVGESLKGAINKYGSETKKSNS